MARKSRTGVSLQPSVVETAQVFPTAIYARLSVKNSGKEENRDVIANQIAICKSYIEERPYLCLTDTYIDNGWTGTAFDRPEFNRLMDDIRNGTIKCLVVRDLSRFGRDYIEAATYMECLFPQIGLRFISIKEMYDSFDLPEGNESLVIPLQNMINSLYSRDISRKVSTALKAQMAAGTFQKRNLPYGYMWNEAHTNMVIDEDTAPYVRMMFHWKLEGWSMPAMLDELDRLGAPNPELRKRQTGTRSGDGCSCQGWHKSTLSGILSNPHYVGDTVLGRSEKAIYKGVRPHNIYDRNEWIIFPDTHEAIISREDFEKVQVILQSASERRQQSMKRTAVQREALVNLFSGKIICADCGKQMYFHRKRVDRRKCKCKDEVWYAFYECSTSASRRYEHCTPHYLRQNKLERDVLAAIQLQVKAALDYDKLLGMGVTAIVRYLNEKEIPTPIQYARSNGLTGNYDDGDGSWNSRSVKYILTNRTYTGMLVQGKEKRVVEATHEPLVDSVTFDAIQKAFQSRAYNVVPKGESVDNILKGKIICGCCGGKMQRKRGTNHADWYFFTCITKNRLGADKCTGMYAREEDIFNAIYRQLKDYVNEHYITNLAYKQKVQEFTVQIANLTQRKATAWINAMEHYEKYVQGEIRKEEFRAAQDIANQVKETLIQATEGKAAYEQQYAKFRKLLSASSKNIPLSEIVYCIDKIVVDDGRKIVVKWYI